MPNYSWHLPQRCGQRGKPHQKRVLSSSGAGSYSVLVHGAVRGCTCPGWRYHGRCKHVAQVEAEVCGWELGKSPQHQTLQKNVACICPACGAETELTPAEDQAA